MTPTIALIALDLASVLLCAERLPTAPVTDSAAGTVQTLLNTLQLFDRGVPQLVNVYDVPPDRLVLAYRVRTRKRIPGQQWIDVRSCAGALETWEMRVLREALETERT